MLFVVLFYSSFIAEPRPTFEPKEQYISGVCNYMLLTMCQVYHCMTIRFFLFFVVGLFFVFFSRCLRDRLLWATGNLENLLHG